MRRNAHFQLLATLLNTMANASFTVGIAAPIAAGLFYGQATRSKSALSCGHCRWFSCTCLPKSC
jgi:hypothetical protein